METGDFLCIKDTENINIFGDFDSEITDNLMIVIEACDSNSPENIENEIVCAADDDEDYITYFENKYLLIVENSSTFI